MTLQDFVNSHENAILWYTSHGHPTGTHEFVGGGVDCLIDTKGLWELTGNVLGDTWEWHGDGNPTDESGNTIREMQAWHDPARWHKLHAEYLSEA